MLEQRLWTVQSIISSKIQECDEFWIFETLQERDNSGNIIHYSYWDSWWCVAEVMEVLQMHTRGLLSKKFKLHIFNPTLPDKYEEIKLEDLPKLTAFEERELMCLKCEGNIERSNLHLRDDKRGFRDASWIMKKLRYKVLKVQWNQISQMYGEDISIPFDQYVEDVNCRVYDDAFLTQRIYMDSESMEIGRKRKDVQKLKEVNCAVLGNYYECQPSVCEVPVRSGEILSYQDKYMNGGGKQSQGMQSTVREIPANLPKESTDFIQKVACDTFRALSCDGVARIDFIIDEATGEIFVNEINTIPGSLSFYLWEYSGINFTGLIDKLIEIAFRRKRYAGFKAVNYGENIFAAKGTGGAKTGGKFGSKMGGKMG